MVFAGVGLTALPLDCIKEFIGRPRSTITRSEYLKRAQGLGVRAKKIKVRPLVSVIPFKLILRLLLSSCIEHMSICAKEGLCGRS